MVYRGRKTQFVAEIVCVVSRCCLLSSGTGNNLVVYYFLQSAGGCAGGNCGRTESPAQPSSPRLEPSVWWR